MASQNHASTTRRLASFRDLHGSYLRLHAAGIEPDMCIHHRVTLSYHYKDPDGNRVELQIDGFGDWPASKAGQVSPAEPPVEIPVEG